MIRRLLFVLALLSVAVQAADSLADAAREQVGVTVDYCPDYQVIPYPAGDVAPETGVCSDVVVRAFRRLGLDLQQAVHEDMQQHFAHYPKLWGLRRPDRHIDHRRVPNLQCYFRRRGWSLPVTDSAEDYQAGDVVTCMVGETLPHIMIVSDRRAPDGTPLIIHNIGSGTEEEEGLFLFDLTGHYRPQLPSGLPPIAPHYAAPQGER